jgi:hypothetical protein
MMFRLTLIAFVSFAAFCYAQTPSPAIVPKLESGVEGSISVSPAHGGPVRPGFASSKPLANTTFVVSNDSGPVAEFTTNDHGGFKVAVPPGRYSVARKGQQKGIGRYGPFDVNVVAGQITRVEWQCDSGMR